VTPPERHTNGSAKRRTYYAAVGVMQSGDLADVSLALAGVDPVTATITLAAYGESVMATYPLRDQLASPCPGRCLVLLLMQGCALSRRLCSTGL